MKVLHLVDDEKFIHFIYELFTCCVDGSNDFVLMGSNGKKTTKFLGGIARLTIADDRFLATTEFATQLMSYDLIIAHSLDLRKAKIILKAPAAIPILWSGWGADYYEIFGLPMGSLYGPMTEKLLNSSKLNLSSINDFIIWIGRKLFGTIRRRFYTLPLLFKAIKRVDYFSAPIPEDYRLAKFILGNKFTPKYSQINYGSLEKSFLSDCPGITGKDILLGNSAAPSNNHLDLFSILKLLPLEDRRIVTPLSYGSHEYAKHVISAGRNLFGTSFEPILDFIPLNEYNNKMARCAIGIMGHRRQQGIGISATMLFRGAKLFLEEASPFYSFLKTRGAHVFTMEELQTMPDPFSLPLSETQVRKNQSVIASFWGQKMVEDNARIMLGALCMPSRTGNR
jgi:hypothetical protein